MRQKEAQPKNFFIYVILVFLLLLSLLTLKLVLSFKKSVFNKLSRISLVLVSEKPQVILFSFQEDKGEIVNLPVKEKVVVARGFGEYELGKVYPLGELDKKGGILLQETVQTNLSLPIFGFFYSKAITECNNKTNFKSYWSNIFVNSIKGEIKTNLTFYDLVLLYFRSQGINETSMSYDSPSSISQMTIEDKALRKESYSIEVLNSTDHSGLAQKISSILENSGGRVIRVSEYENKQKECSLIVSKSFLKSYTAFWLTNVFGCSSIKVSEGANRADFTLIVGEDYWKKLSEKW